MTRMPPGKSLPYHLAGSTAELDFVRSILAYQTGMEPGTGLRPGRLHDGPSCAGRRCLR